MKNLIWVILIVALIGGGALFYMNQKGIDFSSAVDPAKVLEPMTSKEKFVDDAKNFKSLLPAEPVVYMQVNDINQRWNDFINSPVGQAYRKINIKSLITQLGDQQALDMWQSFEEQMESELLKLLTKTFFGDDLALVVYPKFDFDFDVQAFDEQQGEELIQKVLSSFYLISRLTPEAKVAEFFGQSMSNFGDEVTKETVTHGDYDLQVFNFADTSLSVGYTIIDGMLVVGAGEAALTELIDTQFNGQTLKDDEKFLRAQKMAYSKPLSFSYFDIDKLLSTVEEFVIKALATSGNDEQMVIVKQQFDNALKSARGFKQLAISSASDDLEKARFTMTYDLEQMDPLAAKVYKNCRDVDNKTIQYVPTDILYYQWGACFDVKTIYEQIMRELEVSGEAGSQAAIQSFEAQIGLSLENDILTAFGDEVGFFLSNINMSGFFPIPEFTLMVKVADKLSMDKILSKLDGIPMLQKQTAQYNEMDYHYLMTPLGEMLQPSYGYMDEFFFLTINQSLYQNMIDVKKAVEANLSEDYDFGYVKKPLMVPATNISYLNVDLMAAFALELLEWGNNWLAAQDQQKAAFISGTQKRLNEVATELETKATSIANIESQIEQRTTELSSLPEADPMLVEKQGALDDVQAQLVQAQTELVELEEQQVELESMLAQYNAGGNDAMTRQVLMEDLVKPIIHVLEKIEAYGAVSHFSSEGQIESTSYTKMKEE